MSGRKGNMQGCPMNSVERRRKISADFEERKGGAAQDPFAKRRGVEEWKKHSTHNQGRKKKKKRALVRRCRRTARMPGGVIREDKSPQLNEKGLVMKFRRLSSGNRAPNWW